MVRRAGGTVAGKTVISEFATREPGPTTNPRDPTRTPGGSSSGSAAAVAAGFLPFAIGTQTGGSTIGPASFCGVAALKPSFGLVPYSGIRATSWTLDTLGFYGRNVRDVAFLAGSITGQDLAVNDGVQWMPRIGVARMKVWEQISADMSEAIVAASRYVEESRRTCGLSASPSDLRERLSSAVPDSRFREGTLSGL